MIKSFQKDLLKVDNFEFSLSINSINKKAGKVSLKVKSLKENTVFQMTI